MLVLIVVSQTVILIASCKKSSPIEPPDSPQEVIDYNPVMVELDYPSWFPEMPLSDDNPLTEQGIALGRKLYHEPLLHPQASMSCSSCHYQEQSFTINTSGTAVLPHINLGWSSSFLWNGKVEGRLEDIMLFEVAEFFGTDLSKLKNHPNYPDLFYEAFGDRSITNESCAKALAQFFRTMISDNSRFDRYYPGKIQPTLAEVRGEYIFNSERGDCFHCHPQPLFTDNQFHNIGLDSVFDASNEGRFAVTNNNSDRGLFKTPTLRNVALTAPYMHDGRFKTLEEVIDHYDHGVHSSSTLDPMMTKSGKLKGLNLSQEDKANLLAFLLSLTDSSYTTDSNLSKP